MLSPLQRKDKKVTTPKYIISPFSRGYVQVYTGDGKGKTTAALGLAMRACGAGLKVYIGQFIKEMVYGEVNILRERFPEVTVELFGTEEGCIVGRAPNDSDVAAARKGLQRAREILAGGEYDLVILDEITIPVAMGLLREEDLLELIDIKPENVELIMTGRSAPKAVVDRADLVSEVKEVKHYYNEGVLSRKGIEC